VNTIEENLRFPRRGSAFWGALVLAALMWHGSTPCVAAEDNSKPAADAQADKQDEGNADTQSDNGKTSNGKTSNGKTSNGQSTDGQSTEEPARSVEEDPPAEEVNGGAIAPPAEEPKKPRSRKKKHVIGATAVLMEKKSELLFRARVDSGAKSCSLHVEEMVIENEAEKMADNIGKRVRFKIKNGKDETWLTEKISGYVIIKTSDNRERRYKVPLTLRWKNVEKTVLVTLNDRNGMEYRLLLGRNFLRGDFLVDVDLDNND